MYAYFSFALNNMIQIIGSKIKKCSKLSLLQANIFNFINTHPLSYTESTLTGVA